MEGVLEFFYSLQDEPRLESLVDDIAAYVREGAKGSRFSEVWLAVLREHLGDICRPDGLFVDRLVTGAAWRGRCQAGCVPPCRAARRGGFLDGDAGTGIGRRGGAFRHRLGGGGDSRAPLRGKRFI